MISIFTIKVSANTIQDITIEVYLDKNGNATITEWWTGEFPDGTENYKVLTNLLGAKLRDFKVSTPVYNSSFTESTPWNVDRSREQKKYQYGIVNVKNGYELCWGTGGFNGVVPFAMEYKLDDFVKRYEDGYTGFNWQFVSYDMDPAPRQVIVRITRDGGFNSDETRVWAFGFNGEINVQDGVIVARRQVHFIVLIMLL